ncbi:MAG: ThiF family adenylyltransferase [Geobacteraceae bacterium]
MSHKPMSCSPDLKCLRDEGYDLEIRSGYLLVKDVPYVNSSKEVKFGMLVSKLILAGDVTARPDDHVAYFEGDYPCREDGKEIHQIKNQSSKRALADDVVIDHMFSAKPQPTGYYEDYYAKVTTYAAILSGPAQVIDPKVTAKTFPVIEPGNEDEETVFNYIDTASSRAEINLVTEKLALGKIAIVGLGGTGSYVLDLVAKTPVKEIHLFDGDTFLQHNAFRSPGAPSIDELKAKPQKTDYFKNLYSKMHRGIVNHEAYVSQVNVEELKNMDFVFLCADRGTAKKLIVEKLEEFDLPFVDVGMGVTLTDDALGGILRVTTSTPKHRNHVRARVSFSDGDGHNEYENDIQIADLNALNAALAVITWKKLFGFYRDLECEHHSTYTIDGNVLTNEDRRP